MDNGQGSEKYVKSLDIAIGKEQAAHAFYEKARKNSLNPGIRDLFGELMEEEIRHERMLIDYRHKITTEEHVKPSEVDIQIPGDLDAPKTSLYPLIIAMKREENAVIFFNDLSETTQDAGLKALYVKLRKEEIKHLERIRKMFNDEIRSRF